MFPVSDDNPRRRLTPFVNWSLVAANLLVWLWQVSLGQEGGAAAISPAL